MEKYDWWLSMNIVKQVSVLGLLLNNPFACYACSYFSIMSLDPAVYAYYVPTYTEGNNCVHF